MKLDDLDRYDHQILTLLSTDGRLSWSDLADRIGLSQTPTLRRVRKLERAGIIKGYGAVLDQQWLSGTMPVFVTVKLQRQVDDILREVEERISALPEVVGGYLMSGSNDYLLHAFVRDLDHYRQMLGQLTKLDGIAHIESSFVLKAFKERRLPISPRLEEPTSA